MKKEIQEDKLFQDLRRIISEGFGRKCKTFSWFCAVCSAWLAYDILWELFSGSFRKK